MNFLSATVGCRDRRQGSACGCGPGEGHWSTLVASIALAEAKRGGWFGKVTKGKRRGTSNPGFLGGKGGTAKVRFTSRAEYPSFNLDDNSPAVVHAKKAAVSLGLKPRTVFSNGGLDANWFVKYGLPTVTIGAGQYAVHTLKEYVNLAEYVDGCRLAVALATLA